MKSSNSKQRLPILSVALLTVVIVSMFPVRAQEQPRIGGTMVMGANYADPPMLASFIDASIPTRMVGANVFNGLTQFDAAYNPLPDLAQSWDFSADQLTWTFHLVRNATWHDGVPFTSADVKFTYENLITPEAQLFFSKTNLNSIATPDNYTVVFNWKIPFFEALYVMGSKATPIAPKHLYEGTAFTKNQYNSKPIGTGPFKFQEWVRGDHVTLVRNEKYFKKGLPYLDKVAFRFNTDISSLISQMKAGEIDYLPNGIAYAYIPELNKDPAFNPVPVRVVTLGLIDRFQFNLDLPLFKDVRVRQAFSLAIDRQTIVDKAGFGHGKVSKGVFPNTTNLGKYRSPNVPMPTYDPAAAEKLLDQAGYPRKADGTRFTLNRFIVQTGEPQSYNDPAQLIRDMLKKVGIETNIILVDEATRIKLAYIDRPRGFDVEMFRGRSGPYPFFTSKLYDSRWIIKAPIVNLGENNTEIDKLYDQAKVAASENQRVQAYQKIDEILNRDLPELWIYDIGSAQPIRNTFQGHSFFEIDPECGSVEAVWWTKGTPMTTTTSIATTAGQSTPLTIGAAVVAVIMIAGAYIAYSRLRKKKQNHA